VLNAFRHQREDHAPKASAPRCCSMVLNAFRHQREDHHSSEAMPNARAWCSTPFGINARITCLSSQRQHVVTCVLNAFRHQREDHMSEADENGALIRAQRLSASTRGSLQITTDRRALSDQCSTPFGINARITPFSARSVRPQGSSAQRLSASTRGSRRPCERGPTVQGGAQRLSASTRGSRDLGAA